MTKEIIENDPYKLAGVDITAGNDLVDKIGFGNIFINSGGHLNFIFITITKHKLF